MREILYIVGAGLSKALEHPPNSVPLMGDFISVMADHMRNPVIQKAMAVLLHEGALQWPLAGEIKDFEKRIYGDEVPKQEEIQRISALIKRLPAENIEDILSRSPNVINRISFAINAMFCDINWDVNWESLDKFLSSQMAQRDARHTFLTFNYDLLTCPPKTGPVKM